MNDKELDALLNKVYLQGIRDTLTIMRTVNTARPDPVREVRTWLDRAEVMGRLEARKLVSTTEEAFKDLATAPPPMSVKPNTPTLPRGEDPDKTKSGVSQGPPQK